MLKQTDLRKGIPLRRVKKAYKIYS